MFIVLSGIDGAGKTTQAKRLAANLSIHGLDVLLTREPGGTEFGAKIRQLIFDPLPRASRHTDLLMFLADRDEHATTLIRPALAAGKIVVCDRGVESTFAYQADQIGGNAIEKILALHNLLDHPWPDLMIFIDIDVKTAANRLLRRDGDQKQSTYETTEIARLAALDRRYREFHASSAAKQSKIGKVDGSKPPDELAADILAITLDYLANPATTPSTTPP